MAEHPSRPPSALDLRSGEGASVDDPIREVIERRIPWVVHGELYSQQFLGTGPFPEQGWKLHISASPSSAIEVLEAALDVLLAHGARFKVAGSVEVLQQLNAGQFGISQIGKFISVYPSDDAEAVRLALDLHTAARGHPAPRVPSDRPLRPDSLVHYRYGAMGTRPEAEAAGEVSSGAFDLLDGAGRLTTDWRLNFYLPPPDVTDPFEASGAHVPNPAGSGLLDGRYLVIDALDQSPRGGVFRAVDLFASPARLCLLKEFWHDVSSDPHGRDARDWARNEAGILGRHSADPTFPCLLDSFELDRNHYLAIEYIEGTPLDCVTWGPHPLEECAGPADVLAVGLATADLLAHLHSVGVVFRDFKASNIIRTPSGGYRLIDFGIAHDGSAGSLPALGVGTPRFCPPQQYDGESPTPADDVFAWGAVLHDLACGDRSLAARPSDRDRRPLPREPVCEVNPSFPPPIGAVIDRAVAWERAVRYPSILQAAEALAEAGRRLHGHASGRPTVGGRGHAEPEAEGPGAVTSREALHLASEVGDALCAEAEEHGGGLYWSTPDTPGESPQRSPDLYSGVAGIGLFLAELAHRTGEGRYVKATRGAARWLAGPAWGRGWSHHGLHGGEPGVAYFFVRLAELLDQPAYVTAAELRVRRLRGAPFLTLDLIHGSAGTMVSLLRLHATTGRSEYLADARNIGEELARVARRGPPGNSGRYWEVPSADPTGATAPYLGLLHGAAGIGLALAELAIAADDERFLKVAMGAGELLLDQRRPSGIDANDARSSQHGSAWPRRLGDRALGLQAHCHGAGGIAQFFMRLNRVAPDARYREAAQAAARALAVQAEGETRSCLCHGLGGIGNVLLDCHQAFEGDPQWLALARRCAAKVQRFRGEEQPGTYRTSADGPVSPSLMLGSAGIGSFLLRLADPGAARELILQ